MWRQDFLFWESLSIDLNQKLFQRLKKNLSLPIYFEIFSPLPLPLKSSRKKRWIELYSIRFALTKPSLSSILKNLHFFLSEKNMEIGSWHWVGSIFSMRWCSRSGKRDSSLSFQVDGRPLSFRRPNLSMPPPLPFPSIKNGASLICSKPLV